MYMKPDQTRYSQFLLYSIYENFLQISILVCLHVLMSNKSCYIYEFQRITLLMYFISLFNSHILCVRRHTHIWDSEKNLLTEPVLWGVREGGRKI